MKKLKLVSRQYRARSDCTDVQVGLALYWWQSLITFGVGKIRVNLTQSCFYEIYFRSINSACAVTSVRREQVQLTSDSADILKVCFDITGNLV